MGSPTVHLPARGAIVPVAPAARGKSTLARRLVTSGGLDPSGVVSMDTLRGELCTSRPCACRDAVPGCLGGVDCQCRNSEVWALTNRRLGALASAGRPYLLDAMNLVARSRRSEVKRAHGAGLPAVALLASELPLDELRARNQGRDHLVPDEALASLHARHAQVTPESLLQEGFDEVHVWDDETQFALLPAETDGRHLSGPFAVIGDVHGCFVTLQTLLAELGFDRELRHPRGLVPVLVGDLHDKGGTLSAGPEGTGNPTDSGAVATLRWAMEMTARGRLLVVDSNHGSKLVRAILRPERVRIGPALAETLADLELQPDVEELKGRLVGFLSRLPVSLQLSGGPTGEVLVAHAAMKPELVGRNDRKAAGVCNYLREFEWTGAQTLVVGHVVTDGPVRTRFAPDAGEVLRIDTGCFEGGGLTAYLTDEDRFVHVPTSPADMPSGERLHRNRYVPQESAS